MDKEMKVKIDEFLKAKGMRELNLDEMDKVSGGGDKKYDETGRSYVDCECGGRAYRMQTGGGWCLYVCNKCGDRFIGG